MSTDSIQRPSAAPDNAGDKTGRRSSQSRRRTPSCVACASAKVRCVGQSPCARCKARGTAAAAACKPAVWRRKRRYRAQLPTTSQLERAEQHDHSNWHKRQRARKKTSSSSEDAGTGQSVQSAIGRSGTDTSFSDSDREAKYPVPSLLVAGNTTPALATTLQTDPASAHAVWEASPFGVVVLQWDTVPFNQSSVAQTGGLEPWANQRVATWLGYTPSVIAMAFNSFIGLPCVMEERSIISFMACLFQALTAALPTFSCSVKLRGRTGTLIRANCLGSLQYGPRKKLLLCLSQAQPAQPAQSAPTLPLLGVQRSSLPSASSSESASSSMRLNSASSESSSWVIDHDPMDTQLMLGDANNIFVNTKHHRSPLADAMQAASSGRSGDPMSHGSVHNPKPTSRHSQTSQPSNQPTTAKQLHDS